MCDRTYSPICNQNHGSLTPERDFVRVPIRTVRVETSFCSQGNLDQKILKNIFRSNYKNRYFFLNTFLLKMDSTWDKILSHH